MNNCNDRANPSRISHRELTVWPRVRQFSKKSGVVEVFQIDFCGVSCWLIWTPLQQVNCGILERRP